MKKYLFLIIGLFLFMPNVVNAKEYTFNICKSGCEYDENSLNDIDREINSIRDEDSEDNMLDNNYIINIADGEYHLGDLFLPEVSLEIKLGKGKYYFGTLNGYIPRIVFTGSGIDETMAYFSDYVYLPDSNQTIISDMTMNLSSDLRLMFHLYQWRSCPDYEKKFILSNLRLNFEELLDMNLDIEIEGDLKKYLNHELLIDNVSINKLNSTVNFLLSSYEYSYYDTNFIIKNSDFSQSNINFNCSDFMKFSIVNSKLDRIYSSNVLVNIDCDSVFNYETKKQTGDMYYRNFFEQDEYNLYEYYDERYEYNAKIITEVCKDKSFKINKRLSLSEIKDEFGYDIDDTWTFNPEGIIELKDNVLVPLKVGKTKLSKEIDGEVKTLRLEVTDIDKKNKAIDKSTDNIVNPKTAGSVFVILILLLLVIPATILVKKRSVN